MGLVIPFVRYKIGRFSLNFLPLQEEQDCGFEAVQQALEGISPPAYKTFRNF